jgi:His-Xaa-Ser system radical SAM maturase HxsC
MMCPQPPRKEDIMDWVEICVQTIKLINPSTECLGITGGEPTRNWTGLMRVLDSCNKYLPETKFQLLTNGRIFKDYKKAEELAEIAGNKILIGLSIYSDVDGHHDKLCGTRGAFWDSIEGLYNLERVGIPIELRTVIMKENYERLKGFSNFVYRNLPFVACVVFMAMEPIGNAHKNIKKLWIDPADYMENLEEAIKILSRRDINTLIFNHQLCTLPNNLWPLSVKSISEWKIIYLDECNSCIEKQKCGGFFFSQKDIRSRMIRPIR